MDISIVVPTYNRKDKLKQCLESLFTQSYPSEGFEIIVIDDGSADGTVEMMRILMRRYRNLKYLKQSHKGPATARNLGVKYSLGKIIGFADDDCIPHKDWVGAIIEAHYRNPEMAAVGGLTVTSTLKSHILVSQFLSNYSVETHVDGQRQVIFFPTCNVSLKRRIFDKYEFNGTFLLPGGEDLEFFWKLFKDGHRFVWDKNIKAVHYRDGNSAAFLRQAYIYGRGNLLAEHLHKDHPLLKELETGKLSFWLATLFNILKIPRFSYLLGIRLIQENGIKNTHKKLSIYAYLIMHKIFYILGNIVEFIRLKKENVDGAPGINHLPRLLVLDITHSCNLQCSICDIWKTAKSEKDIGIFYIKKLLRQAKELGIKEIALSGGEALLRKDIFNIFDYARNLKIKNLGVLTNGIMVKKNLNKLQPYLIDNTISLVISLDSLKQDLHNQIRNYDLAWQETIESLKMLSVMKKTYPQLNFNLISIIFNQNLEELPDLAVFVKSSGANSLQFQALLPNNLKMAERTKSGFWVAEERLPLLDTAIDRLIELKKENQQFIKNSVANLSLMKKYYRGTLTSTDVKCLSAYQTILTSNQGTYATCFGAYGDLRAHKLKDVLKSKQIIQAREKVKGCHWPCLLPCFTDYPQ